MMDLQLFGLACPPYFGESKFYEDKKAKAVEEIIKQAKIIEECDKEIANANKE